MSKHLLPKVFSSRSHPTTTCIKKHLDRTGISFSVSVSVSISASLLSPHTHVGTCMGTCMCLRVCACMDPLAARRKSDLKSSPQWRASDVPRLPDAALKACRPLFRSHLLCNPTRRCYRIFITCAFLLTVCGGGAGCTFTIPTRP